MVWAACVWIKHTTSTTHDLSLSTVNEIAGLCSSRVDVDAYLCLHPRIFALNIQWYSFGKGHKNVYQSWCIFVSTLCSRGFPDFTAFSDVQLLSGFLTSLISSNLPWFWFRIIQKKKSTMVFLISPMLIWLKRWSQHSTGSIYIERNPGFQYLITAGLIWLCSRKKT